MPSIRVYLNPDVAEEMDPEIQLDLSQALRMEVAKTLEIDPAHVEVLWLPLDYGDNTAPVMIDVMYSIRPNFEPDEATRILLADNLAKIGLKQEGMPKSVTEVASWILPQHDAIFRVTKAE